MEMMTIWQESRNIRFGDIDHSDRLTLASVFDFFQEAAISHADNLGVGRDSLEKTGQVWILSRMSVQVDRRPAYGETITIRTWPRGGEKLFALREYDIRDASGRPLAGGSSAWLIIDIEKRRPLRPQAVMEALPLNEDRALPSGAVGLAELKSPEKSAERRAAYSDLDYNGHVNNVRYVQWIQDALEPALFEKAECLRLDINYLNEVLPGELIELWRTPAEDAASGEGAAFAFEGRRPEGGQAAFRAELRVRAP
jgi:acyl-ACP thioesterase